MGYEPDELPTALLRDMHWTGILVPVTGLEPVQYLYRGILSPLCLPIPPHRQISVRNTIAHGRASVNPMRKTFAWGSADASRAGVAARSSFIIFVERCIFFLDKSDIAVLP